MPQDDGPDRFQISRYFRRQTRRGAWYQYIAFGAVTVLFFIATVAVNTLVIAGPLSAEEMSLFMTGSIVMLAVSAVCFNGAFDEWMRWRPSPDDEEVELGVPEADDREAVVEQNTVPDTNPDETTEPTTAEEE